jgi:hypothetical protein
LVPRPAIPYVPAKHEEYTKGDVNPFAKRSMVKMASIDTLFRPNYATSLSTNFSYILPEAIRNVVSMRLASFEMPNMINVFSSARNSNLFFLKLMNVTGKADETLAIVIPDGNYLSNAFVTMLNNVLKTKGATFIIVEIKQSNIVFRARNISDGSSPFDPASPTYSPNFEFKLDFEVQGKRLNSCAGWGMGFRSDVYHGTSNFVDLETNLTYKNYVVSESSYGSNVDNYLFLEVDDFHNNFQTDTIISTNSTSYVGKNILARIVLNGGSFTIIQNNGNDGMFKKREYLGPVRIERLNFRLLDKHGDVVDLISNDYSFALEFTTIYS